MERGSAQHSPRVDDDLAHESAPLLHGTVGPSRDREDLDPEAPAIDELGATPEPAGTEPDPAGLNHAELLARSELARWLLPSAFPANAETLAAIAREQGAPEELSGAIDALGSSPRFETVGELWSALGGPPEHRTAPASEPGASAESDERVMPVPVPAPPVEETAGTDAVVEPLVRLVTLGPRVALAAMHAVGRFVRRGTAAVIRSNDDES